MEHGAPEVNIPARPFMKQASRPVQADISARLKKAGEFALEGAPMQSNRELHRVGAIARDATAKITAPVLAAEAIHDRRAKSKRKSAPTPAVHAADRQPVLCAPSHFVRHPDKGSSAVAKDYLQDI